MPVALQNEPLVVYELRGTVAMHAGRRHGCAPVGC